ncbi:sigma factor SigB regulation protein RsbQ [Paenibacillus sambharensis]|uniref:Sigma factor SigB regulation protein RsbQ n=2 Tax=Paenibacillus sambharensis TaxID=1803190 RepID=A0A2W1LDJ8_9BACL|nr:alpha/beta hydrolase [Paenibacillus sambharensis]PZD97176.1 sigma factor SigB regulation protein RsbQ [Paenibacillus sambharensis]
MVDVYKRNHVNVSGHGERPIIFAPGFGCNQNMWRLIAPAFEDQYKVVLFDYVGTGLSDHQAYDPIRYGDLLGYAEDLLQICEAIDARDAILVGHSVGATIAMLAANRDPQRFAHLIMIGPSPCYVNDPPDYYGGFTKEDLEGLIELLDKNFAGWANYLSGAVMQNPDRPSLSRELEESFCSIDPEIARRFAVATFFADTRQELQKVRVPALIMQCQGDIIAPVEVGEYVHDQLPGSIYQLMQATGHCPHLSHPEETISIIQSYLDSIPTIDSTE